MDVPSGFRLLAVFFLVLANGFFVATEFAIVAVRRSRLEELAGRGNHRARAALEIVQRLDIYIAACQLGITMASLALGWIGEPALADLIEPGLARVAGSSARALAHTAAIVIAFSVITALHIIVGELAPKGLALQKTEGTTLWVAGPIRVFYVVFRWPTKALNKVGNQILRLFRMQPATAREHVHSVEELQVLVRNMQEVGVVEPAQAKIASRAMEFGQVTAGSIMTPRIAIEAVPVTITLKELVKFAAGATHDKLPVYEGTIDHIIGYVHIRDLFRVVVGSPDSFSIRALRRSVLRVPEGKSADSLLEEMRATRRSFAVVIDEHGGTAGMVTLEDLAEVLVGRIESEAGRTADLAPAQSAQPDGSLLLPGLTRLAEFEEITGLRADETSEADTVGGLIMERLGRIPAPGDTIEIDRRSIRVEKLDGLRVELVRVMPAPEREEPSYDEAHTGGD